MHFECVPAPSLRANVRPRAQYRSRQLAVETPSPWVGTALHPHSSRSCSGMFPGAPGRAVPPAIQRRVLGTSRRARRCWTRGRPQIVQRCALGSAAPPPPDVGVPWNELPNRRSRGPRPGRPVLYPTELLARAVCAGNISLAQGGGDSDGDDGASGREDAERGHSGGGAGARDHDPCGPVKVADDILVALRLALSGMVPWQFVGQMCLFY